MVTCKCKANNILCIYPFTIYPFTYFFLFLIVNNFPEFLVIADFVSEKFSIEAGETVIVFGGDNDGTK